MKNGLILLGLIWVYAPGLAFARVDPAPPPSGMVIHLFGPNSVMSNVLPTGAAAPPDAVAAPAGAATAAETSAVPAEAPAPAAYPEPSMGNILHQMFVTGDPNDPPRPSTGRSTDRP